MTPPSKTVSAPYSSTSSRPQERNRRAVARIAQSSPGLDLLMRWCPLATRAPSKAKSMTTKLTRPTWCASAMHVKTGSRLRTSASTQQLPMISLPQTATSQFPAPTRSPTAQLRPSLRTGRGLCPPIRTTVAPFSTTTWMLRWGAQSSTTCRSASYWRTYACWPCITRITRCAPSTKM